MKDLSTITGRGDNLARVVLVDNSSTSFVPQPDNGIPIVDFLADPCDSALAPILTLINELKSQEDVRPVLVRRFGLAETLRPLRAQIDGGDQNPRETFSHGSRLCVD
jgi:TFIIF-interacting CTD phosphatase-like protein